MPADDATRWGKRHLVAGLALAALGACQATTTGRPPVAAPSPSAAATIEAPPKPGRYVISLDPWKNRYAWFCFKNRDNPEDPSVCVQTEEECKHELKVKKTYSEANGLPFDSAGCKRLEDPSCTFMYVREGRTEAPVETGKRALWSVSEKVNTCCNYVCSETESDCNRQVAQFQGVVLRDKEREREQMSCDIPCRRWSALPEGHDKDRPLVCQRNHE
jgi:hypothetical protein